MSRAKRAAAKWKAFEKTWARGDSGKCPKCPKVGYRTRTMAKQRAAQRFPTEHMSVYRCESGLWHLGHLPARIKAGDITRGQFFDDEIRPWLNCCGGLQHGTGALNIDGCRVGSDERVNLPAGNKPGGASLNMSAKGMPEDVGATTALGRWPANVLLDDSQAAALDEQSGTTRSPSAYQPTVDRSDRSMFGLGGVNHDSEYGDSGGASRFFPTFRYEAKAPTTERPREGDIAHPTVKPLDLMRWLVRLVTPPGGTVLEPFAGSGTTAEACVIEGFNCIAIEREADYLPLIVQRLSKPIQVALI
jgi:hypothetical protein